MDIDKEVQRIHDLIEIRSGDMMNKNNFRYCLLYPAANVMRYALKCLHEGKQHEDYDLPRVERMVYQFNEHIKLLEDNNWRITDVD